jgi:glyoxylase-like metal-dependent hydrolase (beta-lactamase superfamily II)
MNTWKLTDGTQIWQVLSGRSNSFLVLTPEGVVVLVDTGMEYDRKALIKNVVAAGVSDLKINYLLLTHTHFDHCRNAAYLKENSSCQIVVSQLDASFAQSGYTPVPGGTNPFTKFISKPGKAIGQRWFGYHAFEPDILVDDNFMFLSGISTLQVICTPGHTAGSVSLILNGGIAIVGDALFGVFPNRVLSPFADDASELVRSWKRLLDTGCSIFLSGHGFPITRQILEREYARYSKKFGVNC